jgi:hypothetical protein
VAISSTRNVGVGARAASRGVRLVLAGRDGRPIVAYLPRLRDAPDRLGADWARADTKGATRAFDPQAYPHELVACNLCGGTDASAVVEQDRYGLPTRIVQCDGCGLQFINPRMTAEGYAAFYQHGYRPLLDQYRGPRVMVDLETDQRMYAADVVALVGPMIPTHGTLLDVGGSTGIVGRAFAPAYDVTVIDPAPDELARALGCRTICGTAETVMFPTADVALLCRTVDHLRDPLGVLRRLRVAARWLVVDAMDVDQWPARGRYKVDHPYAFTAETLRRMVDAAGWTIRLTWTRRRHRYIGVLCS